LSTWAFITATASTGFGMINVGLVCNFKRWDLKMCDLKK